MAKQKRCPRRKPEPIDDLVIWPTCMLKVIDEATNRWKTVAEVLDTLHHIEEAKQRLQLAHVWVFHVWGRELL